MKNGDFAFVGVLVLAISLPFVFADQLSTKECEDLGFSGLALCSDCDAFAEYVKNDELVADCRKCCTEDSDDSSSKVMFSGAVLQVCTRKLTYYPELLTFIEEEKDQFPAVKIQYVYSSPPKLVMVDEDGNHQETIRIDNWKREHIRQFLREKVKPSADH
ncbi:selenoprotein family protein [Wolffia australiana]